MSIFVKAINLYKKYGYDIKTGLNPMHFGGKASLYFPFTYVFEKGSINELITGGGIAPVEVYMIESLSSVYEPKNIFIVGNAFGWSTIVMTLAFSKSKIVVIDAGIEGKDNMLGIELSNKIAKNENLNFIVEYGYSPQNNRDIIGKHFGDEKIDFVFIDGLHTNEQLLKDFYGVLDYVHENTIFLFHDVINWKMESAFLTIKNYLRSYNSTLLYRTTSGMAVCLPKQISDEISNIFDCFTENSNYVQIIKNSITTKAKIKSFIGSFLPKFLKDKIKKVID